jgi:alkanesulfonate monooxygenase SsuD/methylene tetrahydromethanopterin reductase-like flavin-dependent oxidoreductase (luciferase family)
MQIAVQIMTNYADTLRLARWSENNGVAALAVADHYLSAAELESPALDQLVVLGGIARETEHLALCTLVSPLTFRHPAVHLKMAVTLDQMSGGRFSIGIGTGWMEEEHQAFGLELHSMAERFDRLGENLAYIRAALDPRGPGFQGHHVQLAEGFVPQPQPADLRIVVGGGGANKTPALAGRYADEFNVFPGDVPMGDRIERANAAFREAGRHGELFISTAFPPVAGSDRRQVEAELGTTARRSGETTEEIRKQYRQLGIPVGEVETIGSALSGLTEIGVQRVYLQCGRDVERAIRQAELFLEAARTLDD